MKGKCLPPSLDVGQGFRTHVGTVRSVNEDAVLYPKGGLLKERTLVDRLWAVADGMGGHRGGRVASRLACRGLRTFIEKSTASDEKDPVKNMGRRLTETLLRVDRLVRWKAAARPWLAHMGTTLSCLLLADGHSIIAHVGDSRIYRWRRGHLTCLTTDHTFVQEMIFEGEVDPAKAHLHPLRHLLTNVVGTQEPLCHVEERIDRIRAGDRFLLCTDGLTNVLDAASLSAVMASDKDAGGIAEDLVAAALERNTRDNVTALVVQVFDREENR